MKNLAKRMFPVVLSLVLVMSMTIPTAALATPGSGDSSSGTSVTIRDLPDYAVPPAGKRVSDPLTLQEVIYSLLKGSGLSDQQLGTYPDDYNALAQSMGMIEGTEDFDADCTAEQLASFLEPAQTLYDSLHREDGKLVPLFMNGRAMPIFPYTSGAVSNVDNSQYSRYGGMPASEEIYSNEDSDIIRYFVYVETDYDTDGDGKLDLVKALVQVPRAAAEGDYEAATIFEARPYITGCTNIRTNAYSGGTHEEFKYEDLYAQPAARVPSQEPVSTLEAAADADSNDWFYWNPEENIYDYEDLDWYDYYLVRGFAVVESGGLGTLDSDGFETCGTDLEIAAFKNIVEWLHGDRIAYTDKVNNIPVKADWSAGHVGTTGRSYAGTTQFGMATTGVEGLDTIVPVAGIASWYEYTNSQGIQTRSNAAYVDYLAAYCAGRHLNLDDWNTIQTRYYDYLHQLYVDQREIAGDYFDPVWSSRDYTLDAENIKIPALIVHGLNDYNVRTKQAGLMYNAFKEAGQPVKFIFHQDGHLTPTYPAGGIEFLVNGQLYDEILNQWFSHYLCGVENGIENMPAVQAQSNQNPDVWNEYDSWEPVKELTVGTAGTEDITISSNYTKVGVTNSNYASVFSSDSTSGNALFVSDVTQETLIKGSIAVKFSATVDNEGASGQAAPSPRGSANDMPRGGALDHDNFVDPATFGLEESLIQDDIGQAVGEAVSLMAEDEPSISDRNSLMVSAMLVDLSDTAFPTVNTSGSYVTKEVLKKAGAWQGGGLKNWDFVRLTPSNVNYKVIARGWMDLCNPAADFDSATASEKVALQPGKVYDYTIYLQPNIYTIPAGHQLGIVVYAYEPGMMSYSDHYEITLKGGSVKAVIPADKGEIGEGEYKDDSVRLSVSTTRNAGSVTIKDDEDNTVSAGNFPFNKKLTLTANVNNGYTFTRWTVNGVEMGTDRTLSLTMDEDKGVSAEYTAIPTHTLTVTKKGNGNVETANADGGNVFVRNNTVYHGTNVIFTATPEEGSVFNGWTVNGESAGNDNPMTMKIEANTTVEAEFAKVWNLTIEEAENGTVEATAAEGDVFAEEGKAYEGEVTFTATPEEGYEFDGWTVNGEKAGTDNPIVIDITEDTVVQAAFKKIKSGGGGSGGGSGGDVTPPDDQDDACKQDESCPIYKFKDSDPKAWYHDGVHYVLEEGIMNGTGDTAFAPNETTTRAMIVTILWRMEGEPSAEASAFEDLEKDSWYEAAVNWAAANNIVNGYSETQFGPTDKITREQLAAILFRYAKIESEDDASALDAFTDADSVSDWATDAMAWAVSKGIITGMTDTTLEPKGNATRAQVATILMRYSK